MLYFNNKVEREALDNTTTHYVQANVIAVRNDLYHRLKCGLSQGEISFIARRNH